MECKAFPLDQMLSFLVLRGKVPMPLLTQSSAWLLYVMLLWKLKVLTKQVTAGTKERDCSLTYWQQTSLCCLLQNVCPRHGKLLDVKEGDGNLMAPLSCHGLCCGDFLRPKAAVSLTWKRQFDYEWPDDAGKGQFPEQHSEMLCIGTPSVQNWFLLTDCQVHPLG